MGNEMVSVTISIHCLVSRHNSAKDVADNALVEEIRERVHDAVKGIIENPRYTGLISYTDGMEGS